MDGVGRPLLRSGCLTVSALIAAIGATIVFDDGNAFFIVIAAAISFLWLVESNRKNEREAEKRAANRFLGIEDE